MASISREQLTLGEAEKEEEGCFVKRTTGIVLAVVVAVVIAVVALIVYYAAPGKVCDDFQSLEPHKQKQTCVNILPTLKKEMCEKSLGSTSPQPSVAPTTPSPERATGLRLNRTLTPSHYNVEVRPHLNEDEFGFDGSVGIWMTAQAPTDVITLHVDELTIHGPTVVLRQFGRSGPVLSHRSIEEDVERQFLKIFLSEELRPNINYVLTMEFNGTLVHPDWRGFYRSSYKEDNVTKYLASTQFQRTHARRAFPCFDEPSFKATFNVTLVRMANFSSISNMPLNYNETRGDGWVADVYQKSVVMPTYLVAFVVSQFSYKEKISSKGRPMRIWARPSFIDNVDFAMSISENILEAFENWTMVPYSLPKMDQIAIPDFRSGAMENWGLVTYRETAVLYNPAYSDMTDRRWVGSVIAHELAHQWFGNLITCHWWDDTFLNEGFATYFGDMVGLQNVIPAWNMDEFFLRRVQFIMESDSTASSQPVYVPDLEHHDDLMKAFDRITYYKGGSVLRMMKYFLTEHTFRNGISNYLRRHQYGTVVHEDLYKALQEQALVDGTITWDTTKTNLSGIMDTWIEQMNYPLVTVTDLRNGRVKVEQSHFLYDHNQTLQYPSPFGEFIWDIPLTFTDKQKLVSGHVTPITWLHRRKAVELTGLAPLEWKLVNLLEQGFYRVKYDNHTWNAILNQLRRNHRVIPVENRAELIDDAFSVARAGLMSEVDALRSTEYMANETEYLPWMPTLRGRTGYYKSMFYGTPSFDQLAKYLLDLVVPMYNRLGWDVRETDPHLDRYTRTLVISEACTRKYRPCLEKATQLFGEFKAYPTHNPIPPDVRSTVYCTGVAQGGPRDWEFIREMYEREYDVYIAYEKEILKRALFCARLPSVIRRHLDYALEKNASALFTGMAIHLEARDTVWNYLEENWDAITSSLREATLSSVASTFTTAGQLQKLERFEDTHDLNAEFTATTVVKNNMAWLAENEGPIVDWLTKVNKGHQPSVSERMRAKRSVHTSFGQRLSRGGERLDGQIKDMHDLRIHG